MKKIALVFGLLLIGNGIRAETVSYSSVSLRSVNYVGGPNAFIHFTAIVNEQLRDIAVDLDQVEIRLEKDSENYTILDLIDVTEESGGSGWLKARKAIVVIRNESDFEIWKKFLIKLKKERELERKRFFEPRRVLPPTSP